MMGCLWHPAFRVYTIERFITLAPTISESRGSNDY